MLSRRSLMGAGALGLGYSNIFVTAPSPENLRTLFEFVFKARGAACRRHPKATHASPTLPNSPRALQNLIF